MEAEEDGDGSLRVEELPAVYIMCLEGSSRQLTSIAKVLYHHLVMAHGVLRP